MTADRVLRKISRMTADGLGDTGSLDTLHEQSVELIMHACRLQQEFAELREASKLLRKESLQLREDCQLLRRIRKLIIEPKSYLEVTS